MENLDLTYELVDLKIKSRASDQIYYFCNTVIVITKGKIRNSKLGKFIYFCCHPFPLRLLQPPPPKKKKHFSRQNFLKVYFIETWVSGQMVRKLKQNGDLINKSGTRKNPSSERGLLMYLQYLYGNENILRPFSC